MIRELLLTVSDSLLATSDIDARIAITSVVLITLAIYISNFNPIVSISAIGIAILACRNFKKILNGLKASIPFIAFFSISSYFLSGDLIYIARISLGITALVLIGIGMLYGILPEEITKALVFFRIPYRYAFLISLAFRMFQIYVRDLIHVIEALKLSGESGLMYYKKLLKTFVSIAVLRSIAISETLYSRGFGFCDVQIEMNRVKRFDCVILILSVVVLGLSFYI